MLCLVNDSSLRGGFMLNFLDDGQGMTSGKKLLFLPSVQLFFLPFVCSSTLLLHNESDFCE